MPTLTPGERPVLVSWLAVNNDPMGRDGEPGPTLTLLCDPDSPYRGLVEEAVIFYNQSDPRGSHYRTAEQLRSEIDNRSRKSPNVHVVHCPLDPVDHKEIFETMRGRLQALRDEFPGREFVIHVSPGTPAMHTAWVLLAETGGLDQPYRLVKTVRRRHRGGDESPVKPIDIGLETPLRSFKSPKPQKQIEDEGSDVRLDPSAYESKRRRDVFEEARRYAQVRVPIMITGERGTGKSQLADWIRLNSPFRRPENDDSPPKVACGQFSGDLVRSEIFGHREGAFTGATSDREGLMARADDDTLFLDEVGDLGPEVQRLLIRAVENKEYTPHGSDEVRESSFRLITATNLSWGEIEDRLAADFLDRISYFTVEMPPLRETPEDLPVLWGRVLQTAADRAGVQLEIVEKVLQHREAVIDHLQGHPLPGNFRDLFRLAYYIFAYAQDDDTSVAGAVEYGLKEGLSRPQPGSGSQVQHIRRAYGEGDALPPTVLDQGPINTGDVLDSLRQYLGQEIRRLAEFEDGKSPADLCDVSARSLQKWAKIETKH